MTLTGNWSFILFFLGLIGSVIINPLYGDKLVGIGPKMAFTQLDPVFLL